jgi:hypothetical protein
VLSWSWRRGRSQSAKISKDTHTPLENHREFIAICSNTADGGVKVVDAGIVAALIGAVAAIAVVLVTAVVGLRTYPRQKEVERREELRKGRGTAYGEYLAAYADVEHFWAQPA